MLPKPIENYKLKHVLGTLVVGITSLAGFISTVGIPSTGKEWTVVILTGLVTIAKAVQSYMGGNEIAPLK